MTPEEESDLRLAEWRRNERERRFAAVQAFLDVDTYWKERLKAGGYSRDCREWFREMKVADDELRQASAAVRSILANGCYILDGNECLLIEEVPDLSGEIVRPRGSIWPKFEKTIAVATIVEATGVEGEYGIVEGTKRVLKRIEAGYEA